MDRWTRLPSVRVAVCSPMCRSVNLPRILTRLYITLHLVYNREISQEWLTCLPLSIITTITTYTYCTLLLLWLTYATWCDSDNWFLDEKLLASMLTCNSMHIWKIEVSLKGLFGRVFHEDTSYSLIFNYILILYMMLLQVEFILEFA